jgi:hypothetical protein
MGLASLVVRSEAKPSAVAKVLFFNEAGEVIVTLTTNGFADVCLDQLGDEIHSLCVSIEGRLPSGWVSVAVDAREITRFDLSDFEMLRADLAPGTPVTLCTLRHDERRGWFIQSPPQREVPPRAVNKCCYCAAPIAQSCR